MSGQLYPDCCSLLQNLSGQRPLYFETALIIKQTPHSPAFAAWAACLDENGRISVLERDEGWKLLSPEMPGSSLLLGSLYQRLRLCSTMKTI
jgi:hypothetical protein